MPKYKHLTLKQVFWSIITALIIAEIYFYLIPLKPPIPSVLRKGSIHFEPAVYARHRYLPNDPVAYEAGTLGITGPVKMHINNQGYRGEDFPTKKPEGEVRVIVYGGSAVFDIFANEGADWPSRVEQHLKNEGVKNANVINAGISGHASADSVGRLFTQGHHFKPDYVLLYNAWNDLKDFSSDEFLFRSRKPHNPENNPFTTYHNFVDRFLSENVRLYTWLRYSHYNRKLNMTREGSAPKRKKTRDKIEIKQAALDQYKLNVEMFVDCARNIGATPILMTQARLVMKEEDDFLSRKLKGAYRWFDHDYIYESFAKSEEIIKAVAREKQVPLIDASAHISGQIGLFEDHVHLSLIGSEYLSVVVAEFLKELIK